MKLKLVLLLGATTACTAAVPLGSGALEPVCARGGACVAEEAAEESSLIQRGFNRLELQQQQQEQQQQARQRLGRDAAWPSISGLKDAVSGAVGQVADAASGLSAGVLSKFAEGLSEQLTALATQVQKLTVSISTEQEYLTSGLASLLAKAFHANLTTFAFVVNPQSEQMARNSISNAFTTWSSVSTSLKVLSGTIGTALKSVGADDLQQKLNVSMQAALTSCEGLAASLGEVQGLLPKESASEPQQSAVLMQQEVGRISGIAAMGSSMIFVPDASLAQASASPRELCTQFNSTLKAAGEVANSFANSFADVFDELSDYMVKLSQDKLSVAQALQVQESFQLVAKAAKDIGDEVRNTSASLFGALGAGVAAAGEAAGIEKGAAADLRRGLLSLLLPALGATAAIFHHLL